MNNGEIGKLGEKYAEKFLISQNYKILANNFRSKFGEIDLIAYDQEEKEMVFVEVKARTGAFFGEPEDAVTRKKRGKIFKTALWFLASATKYKGRKESLSWRLDVIAVKLEKRGILREITHFKNIFADYGG